MVKVTFSLAEATVREIRRTANRLGMAQSHVVREAVADYAARTDRLSESERLRMLAVIERLRCEPTSGSGQTVDAEIEEIRRSRRRASQARPVS